jgi:hypothetical protein
LTKGQKRRAKAKKKAELARLKPRKIQRHQCRLLGEGFLAVWFDHELKALTEQFESEVIGQLC